MSADPGKLSKLLNSILNSFIDLCECDGGAIFTVRKDADKNQTLSFEAMVTRSIQLQEVPLHLKNLRFSFDDPSLAARTAKERRLIKVSFQGKSTNGAAMVDKILKYETRNILSAPLITPRGDLLGVVQLLNKNFEPGQSPDEPGSDEFNDQHERICSIMAVQAALAIENSMLLEEQEQLMEGFVKACVTAIESRDSVTSGHSMRVSDYTVTLASAITRNTLGLLAETNFNENQIRELRYAAMLHDIGKISVKEEVLNKEKKLQGWELELIRMRLKLMKTHLKMQHLAKSGSGADLNAMLKLQNQIDKLNNAWQMVSEANEPSVLPVLVSTAIGDLVNLEVQDDEGETMKALTDVEGFKLSIPKGSLTPAERIEIERHVTYTYEILKMVPWSKGLELVPEIAFRHHERLDGTGYPCKCERHDIPVQSRMLAICDIYDALTADDRPYKRAMPAERALGILDAECSQGKLDKELMKIFLEAKIYEVAMPRKEKTKKAA